MQEIRKLSGNIEALLSECLTKGYENGCVTITKSRSPDYEIDYKIDLNADDGLILGAIACLNDMAFEGIKINAGIICKK